MRLPRPSPLPATVPTVALANVGLLLVTFFLLVSGHGADGRAISLPRSTSHVESTLGAACVVAERRVSSLGGESVLWSFTDGRGPAVSVSGLDAVFLEASRLVEDDPGQPCLIRADARLRSDVVDEALDVLERAGVRNVVLWTRGSDRRPLQ